MQVLLLTQVLPFPPDSGPKVKTWNVLKYLAQSHDVTLVSFIRGDQSADVKALEPYCVGGVHTVTIRRGVMSDGMAFASSLLSGEPWMMARDWQGDMIKLIERLAADCSFDVIHADQLNMAQYAELAARRSSRKPRLVLDAHNALWLLYQRLADTMSLSPRRMLLQRDAQLLKKYEGRIVRDFDAVLAVSDDDRAALTEAAGQERDMIVIPIAVDVDSLPVTPRAPDAQQMTHIGTMYWPPNIDGMLWFLREIYPLVRAEKPASGLDVIGARPPQELTGLQSQVAGLNVAGYVADVSPYLARCGVFIVTLRAGGGMRVKILEALARGLPVVTTTLGCEGIAVKDGEHLLIADSPADFARAVVRVLSDPALSDRLSRNGRRLIETTYDYRAACRPLGLAYGAVAV